MLNRLCNSSLKFVVIKQISKYTHRYLAPASLPQQRNYATENDKSYTETLLAKEKTTCKNNDYAKTIENYTTAGNLKDALNVLKQANTDSESFKLNCQNVAELVKLMVKENNPFEEVEAILSAHSPGLGSTKPESCFFLFEDLMSRLAISGQVQLLQKLFDALVKYKYIKATAKSTEHPIKASLQNGAYAQAVDLYEYMDKTYQLKDKGFMTRVLFIQFIQRKEDDLLERLYKLYEQRNGTRHALCCLGFAYSQCGSDQQAKEIFKKVGVLSKDIIRECQTYVKLTKLRNAINLLKATKGINCNRDIIYQSILDIYMKQKRAGEVLNLWREYTNDDILPTQRFKKKLVMLLKANGMEIPLDLNLSNEKKKNDSYKTVRDRNFTESEKLLIEEKNTLNNSGCDMSNENYTITGSLENGSNLSKQAENASFKLDCHRVAELIESMVNGKYPFEEIEAILSVNSEGLVSSNSKHRFPLFKKVMCELTINDQVQQLQKLFDALVKYKYIEANIDSTRYLVNGFMNKGAYSQALDMFEHIIKTYQLTPMSKALFTQLIQHNELDSSKRLFILYKQVCGTRNAFCKLGFAFVECGRDQQAKMAFKKVNVFWKDVILECRRYVESGSLQRARTLLTATKGLNCNRDVIYEAILDICIKQNKAEEALNLWREYTNDEMLQSETFKKKLVTFLKSNSIKVPLDLNLINEKD